MKRICSWLLAILMLLSFSACGQKADPETAQTWQEQYNLGVRYLSEGNYEEAIIAFTAAIKIDPKQPDAYVKLADAYIGVGDINNATTVLRSALERFDDSDLAMQLLGQIESGQFSSNLVLSDVYFKFDAESEVKYLDGNDGAIGGVSVEFTVVEPNDVAYADVETISDLMWLENMIKDMLEFGRGVSPVEGTSYWGIEMPIFDDISEMSQYIVVVAFDSNYNFVGYSVIGSVFSDNTYSETSNSATWGQRIGKVFEVGYQGNGMSIDNVTFMGQSIVNLDIRTMESILHEKGYEITTNNDLEDSDDGDYYWFDAESTPAFVVSPKIDALQNYSSTSVDLWSYTHRDNYHGDPIPVGICNIYTQDSMETVLSKLGFENAKDIVDILNELTTVTFPNSDIMETELEGAWYLCGEGSSFCIRLYLVGTYVDYENSEEIRWSGGAGFNVVIYCDSNGEFLDNDLNIDFSFEDGYLEKVDFYLDSGWAVLS